ncbi:Pentatricopeptide repeat-containing protein [Platanthera guangdongensis]|uniref:Pentatricopeptide repeat-containing protein n=1 Tax=Platanthera guangdongensis TaxID=2320717 RepID=A0ABR2LPZ0_9ASPA
MGDTRSKERSFIVENLESIQQREEQPPSRIWRASIGERTGAVNMSMGEKSLRAVGALLRRLGLPYQGDESYGKIRVNGLALRRWFKPKISSFSVTRRPGDIIPPSTRLAKGLADQQGSIRRSSSLFLD